MYFAVALVCFVTEAAWFWTVLFGCLGGSCWWKGWWEFAQRAKWMSWDDERLDAEFDRICDKRKRVREKR